MQVRMKRATLAMVATTVILVGSLAHANLQVLPTRIVLSNKARTAQVTLRHTGKTETRYRIKPIFYRMQPNGAMEEVKPGEDDRSAIDLIRYSPRQVYQKPNIEQVVRVMLRLPPGLPEGEFRAHLHFEAADELAPGEHGDGADSRMILQARLAVAIPVIVRNGDAQVKAQLSNLKLIKLDGEKSAYSVDLKKEGNGFVYGDFVVTFKDAKGKVRQLSLAKGVSSYIPNRTVSYPLESRPPGKGTLEVQLRAPEDDGGAILASTTKRLD